jgi:hypothetical protein
MATLFTSGTGARVVIVSDDHCPPHVHAFHRGERWVVRLWFSYVSADAGVLSIAPTEQAVRQRQLNELLDEVQARVVACRRIWWEIKGTTYLPNKWAIVLPDGLMVLDAWRAGARQIQAACYDSEGDTTRILFGRGSELTITTSRGAGT